MLQWLGQQSSTLEDRSRAYRLFPDVNRDDRSLEGMCATIVEESFGKAIADLPFLVTNTGDIKRANESVIIPEQLLEVWSEQQIIALLDAGTHLVGLVGSNVKVTLDVEAEIPAGVPDSVVRTVTENSRTLKFGSNSGFESE